MRWLDSRRHIYGWLRVWMVACLFWISAQAQAAADESLLLMEGKLPDCAVERAQVSASSDAKPCLVLAATALKKTPTLLVLESPK